MAKALNEETKFDVEVENIEGETEQSMKDKALAALGDYLTDEQMEQVQAITNSTVVQVNTSAIAKASKQVTADKMLRNMKTVMSLLAARGSYTAPLAPFLAESNMLPIAVFSGAAAYYGADGGEVPTWVNEMLEAGYRGAVNDPITYMFCKPVEFLETSFGGKKGLAKLSELFSDKELTQEEVEEKLKEILPTAENFTFDEGEVHVDGDEKPTVM